MVTTAMGADRQQHEPSCERTAGAPGPWFVREEELTKLLNKDQKDDHDGQRKGCYHHGIR